MHAQGTATQHRTAMGSKCFCEPLYNVRATPVGCTPGTKYPAKSLAGQEGGSGLRALSTASQLQYQKKLPFQTRISAALRIMIFGPSKKSSSPQASKLTVQNRINMSESICYQRC